jgi:hypothetical protein
LNLKEERMFVFKKLVLVPLLLLSFLAFDVGCRHTAIVNVPTGVSAKQVQAWYTATGAMKIIGEETDKIVAAVIQAKPAFPDEQTYQSTLALLGRVAQTGVITANTLKSQPQNFGQPIAQQVGTNIGAINDAFTQANRVGLTKISNPALAAELQLSVSLIQGAITTVQSVVAAQGGQ